MGIWDKSYGERLKEERLKLGFSQTVLAERAEMAYNTYSNYERGTRSPDTDALIKLYILGVDIYYVLTKYRAAVAQNYEERLMLKFFRKLDVEQKRNLLSNLDHLVNGSPVQIFDLSDDNNDQVYISGNSITGNNNIIAGRDAKK
ncbi:hypothetical protein BKG93_11225 [Rodentibacter ratti]|uniref:HTH cro/C1-type domain-containing protein n=1 Tax=Rodentibacter ratti TaxID=1906745 RepID=A0A1V3KXT2_9PAST|nr:helix-turn-helix transcriptional regulator [Rodentibacter ratti]OOF82504.1 hypothetical protein BKG93_11225 [Rodentibacter ratti]